MCLHTIVEHPTDADRLYVAISAAGAFRTYDGGQTWQPINKGLRSGEIPDEDSEVGHCVHRIDMHPSTPDVSTCRSTGTSCAARTAATPGTR